MTAISEVEQVEISEVSAFEEVAPAETKAEKPEQKNEEVAAPAAKAPANDAPKANGNNGAAAGGTKTIRVNIDRLDSLMNLFEELVIDRGRLEQIAKELENNELTDTVERMSRISGDLQSIILNMRMVPVETVFNRFPRMIRQLTKELNKKIELIIEGAETELDRTVIDEIGDPLLHLLRNSLDHGIESPEERVKKANQKKELFF